MTIGATPAGTLCFVGQAVLDQVFHVDAFSLEGGKSVAHGFASRAGGLATKAALAAQALRDPAASPAVRLLSAIGDDGSGRILQGLLGDRGLAATVVPGAATAVSAVLIDAAGERQVHNFRGTALAGAALPDSQAFEHCSGVLADPRWPEAAALALQIAHRRSVPSVLDVETAEPAVLQRLASLADWCVFSRSGLQDFCDCRNAEGDAHTLLNAAAGWLGDTDLVVTLGAGGALWRRPGTRTAVHLPAFAVEAVDTNGAGDVLHGALLLWLAEGAAPADALRRALAAAALACRGAGLPTRRQLDDFLEFFA